MAGVANFFCQRPSQISESRFSRRLDPSTRLAICGLFVRKAHSSSVLPVSCVTKRGKTSCLHFKRVMNEKRELRCIATEIVHQATLLICSWYKTVQNSLQRPDPMTSFGRFLRITADLLDRRGVTLCIAAKRVEGQGCHASYSARDLHPLVASFVRSALPKTF